MSSHLQVSDNSSSLSAFGRYGDGVAAVVWFYGGGDGLCILEDLHGSESCGSSSGSRDPEHPEPPPGCCRSPGQTYTERDSCDLLHIFIYIYTVYIISTVMSPSFLFLSPAAPRSAG